MKKKLNLKPPPLPNKLKPSTWMGLPPGTPLFEEVTDEEIENLLLDLEPERKHTRKKCECGSEKLGYGTHSDWCPKHEQK